MFEKSTRTRYAKRASRCIGSIWFARVFIAKKLRIWLLKRITLNYPKL